MFPEITTIYDWFGLILFIIGILGLIGKIPLPGVLAIIKAMTFMIKAPVALILIIIGMAMIHYL